MRGDHVALAGEMSSRPHWRRRRRRPAAPSSPTSVRNWVKRSTLRSSCGDALLRVRISQPASGNCRLGLLSSAATRAARCVACRQPQPVLPAHQAAGLQQAGGAQRRLADQHPRAEADPAGKLVGFARSARRAVRSSRRRCVTRSPGFRSSRVSSAGSAARAERAVALREQCGERHRRIGRRPRRTADSRRRPP